MNIEEIVQNSCGAFFTSFTQYHSKSPSYVDKNDFEGWSICRDRNEAVTNYCFKDIELLKEKIYAGQPLVVCTAAVIPFTEIKSHISAKGIVQAINSSIYSKWKINGNFIGGDIDERSIMYLEENVKKTVENWFNQFEVPVKTHMLVEFVNHRIDEIDMLDLVAQAEAK